MLRDRQQHRQDPWSHSAAAIQGGSFASQSPTQWVPEGQQPVRRPPPSNPTGGNNRRINSARTVRPGHGSDGRPDASAGAVSFGSRRR